MKFYDYLKAELKEAGLWAWAKDRRYEEVIRKPEVVMAHERAWNQWMKGKVK